MSTSARLLLISLLVFPVAAQIQSSNGLITGWQGVGRSTPKCIDEDFDGFGNGAQAVFVGQSTGNVSAGNATLPLNTVSGTFTGTINGTTQVSFPAGTFAGNYDFQSGMAISGTGIPSGTIVVTPTVDEDHLTLSQAATTSGTFTFTVTIVSGTILTVGTGSVMERVPAGTVSGTNVSVTLEYAHPAGSLVKTQGCAGPDADDRDPLRWTTAHILSKYGTIAAFMAKRGNDLLIDNPIPGDTATAAAIKASYTSPHATWYVSPSGSNSNPCTAASPCANQDGLNSHGYTSGDMVIARAGWSNAGASQAFNPPSGTSSLYTTLVSYPGERAILTGGGVAKIDVSARHYLIFDGLSISAGSEIGGGTAHGAGSSTTHHILMTNIDGMGGGSQGLASVDIFNGLTYITLQDSTLHDNDCTIGGSCQHGVYWGSRDVVSTNITYRRDIAWANDSNGFTFNGRCTSCTFSDLIAYSNGISGLTLEMGVSNSTATNLLLFNNANGGLTIFNYPGDCPAQGGSDDICPYDQTGNVFENITIYQTGNTPVPNPNNTPGSCPTNINYCTQAGIIVNNTTSPLTGNLGSNTFRNVFVSSYGYQDHYPPIVYGDPTGLLVCDSTCLGWMSSSTLSNVVGYQTDGHGGAGILGFGPGSSFGFSSKNCATAASYITITGGTCSIADPLFNTEGLALWTSAVSYDFRLSATSTLIHAGTSTGAPTFDLAGVSYAGTPSVGALEQAPNYIWTNYSSQTIQSITAPVGGAQYSATATATGGTATLTLSGSYYSAYGNQAVANQQVIVTGCSVSAYNTTGIVLSGFTTSTISYPVSGSPGSATGCVVGMSIDGTNDSGAVPSCPTCVPYDYPSRSARFITSWGSAIMTNGDKMQGGGGGHSDSGNNQFYSFDLATNTISALNVPSVITAQQWNSSPTLYKNKDGSYTSRHMFGGLTYIPTVNKIFELGGGPYGNNGNAYFGDTWLIDPATGRGTNQDPVNCPTACGTAVGGYTNPINVSGTGGEPFVQSAYDPNTQTVFSLVTPTGGYMLQYTPCTGSNAAICNSYKIVSYNVSATTCGTLSICATTWIDDVNKNLWILGGGAAYYWNIDGSTVVQQHPTLDSSCNAVVNAAAPGVVWSHSDVLARVYLGLGNDQTVYNFNPVTLSCTTTTYGGATPPLTSNANGTFGRWQYSTTYREFVWIGDYNTGVSILGPQTACHITPTSLPNGTLGVHYSQTLSNIGCSSSTWSVTGSLPTGLTGCSSGSGSSCTISGTPTQTGTFAFNVAYDVATNPYTIIVLSSPAGKVFLPTMIK